MNEKSARSIVGSWILNTIEPAPKRVRMREKTGTENEATVMNFKPLSQLSVRSHNFRPWFRKDFNWNPAEIKKKNNFWMFSYGKCFWLLLWTFLDLDIIIVSFDKLHNKEYASSVDKQKLDTMLGVLDLRNNLALRKMTISCIFIWSFLKTKKKFKSCSPLAVSLFSHFCFRKY